MNGNAFAAIGSKTVTGNNNAQNQYQFLDRHPVSGNNFYRIKSYDLNGQVKYSAIAKVLMDEKNSNIHIYPNPIINNSIHILLNNQPVGNYHFRLINAAGQVLFETNAQSSSSNNTIVIKPKNILPAATYQLEIIKADNNRTTKQIIIAE